MQNANKVSSGIVLLQNVPHKNSRTYCDENYNTSSSFAKEVVSLLKSTNDKRNIQFFFQHPSLKKPHHITTLWFSEVVNYHPNFLYQICTDLELALIGTGLFMNLRTQMCVLLHILRIYVSLIVGKNFLHNTRYNPSTSILIM